VVTVVVDGANVMGSRPDGWWRDRAGAAVRLRDSLARACASGLAVPGFAEEAPEVVLVVEGAAKAGFAASAADRDPVRVVLAPGSGDDTIVDLVRELAGPRVVVTADRELRGRCAAAGASVLGPGWLLGMLDERRLFGPPGPFRRAAHFLSRTGTLWHRREHRSRQRERSAGLCRTSLVLISRHNRGLLGY